MFRKQQLDAMIGEMRREWEGTADFEQIIRDVHLGVAYYDAGRPLGDELHPTAVALIEKHKPDGD